ncbi:MAG: SirB1 family protein [Candidatus Binatia bacterium]
MSDASARFADLASLPDDRIDLAEAALLIALEEYPGLDVAAYLARLDEIASGALPRVRDRRTALERVTALNDFLFADLGFRGNQQDYYDPKNSFLNDVLDRRTGIPITLSLVYCEVGRRAAVPVVGVGCPGHFLVRHEEHPEILVDAFAGGFVTLEECERRLETMTGSSADAERRWLRPARPREILVRMLRNLKRVYAQRNDAARALAAVDRICVLAPDDADELRDRGALYLKLECFAAALRDFQRYLDLRPDGESAPAIRQTLPELERRASRLQ